jgi:hypothetical protein
MAPASAHPGDLIVPRHSTRILGRIVEGIARLSPPCQHDVVQGIVAELDSIADPVERTRFALGAIIAIARLVLSPRTGATCAFFSRRAVDTTNRTLRWLGSPYWPRWV